MNELVKIKDHNGRKAVSARELYEKLGYDVSNWKKWYVKNITLNQFAIENEDYVQLVLSTRSIDFALSLDFAKKLSMMARTDVGEKIRDYFIAIEKEHNESKQVLSPAEALLKQIELMVAQEKEISALKQRTEAIESKVNGLIEIQSSTEAELRALPVSTETLPEMGLRDKIRLLVNRYSQACGVFQQVVWESIYQTLYYNYHVPIKSYGKINKSESWLDVAERKGHVDKIYIIISSMLVSKGLSNI